MIDHWWQKPWLIMDLETTPLPGTDPAQVTAENHVPVQLGAVIMLGGVVVGRYQMFVDPGCPIALEATEVHGITDADVVGAHTIQQAASRLEILAQGTGIFVAYNGFAFDFRIMERVLGADRWNAILAGRPQVDPRIIIGLDEVGRFWRGKGRHKLGAVADRFGLLKRVPGTLHGAATDAELTGLILWHLIHDSDWERELQLLLSGDGKAAEELLRREAKKQQANFEAYLATQKAQNQEG